MRAAIITHSHKIAWALLLALPVILPFIRRAGPVVLVLAACLTLAQIIMRGEFRDLMQRMLTPTTVLIVAFLGWACVTLLWTPVPARGFHAVASATLMVLTGLVLVHGLGRFDPSRIVRWLALSIAIGATIIAVDLSAGGYLLKLIHSRPEPYRYNMVLVSLVALSFGLFHEGVNLKSPIKYISLICLFTAAFMSESETAKIALLTGYIVFFLSPLVPRLLSLLCFMCGVAIAWILFLAVPNMFGELAKIWSALAESGHAAERVQIWEAYSNFALAGLPWGWGAEAVAYVSKTTYFVGITEAAKPWLIWLHPHNNVIQIAAEMGWPGIMLGLASCVALVLWAHADEYLRPARVGFVAAVMIVALVSHGFWQMWWWSAVIASLVLLLGSLTHKPVRAEVVP